MRESNLSRFNLIFSLVEQTIYKDQLGGRFYHTPYGGLTDLYEKQNKFLKANTYYQHESNILFSIIGENHFSHLSENEKRVFLKTFYRDFERYNSFTIKAAKKSDQFRVELE